MANGIIYMQGSSLVGVMLGASILICVLLLGFSERSFATIMKRLFQVAGMVIFSFCQITSAQTSVGNRQISFGSIDHRPWNEMLKKYVDANHRVNYEAWKQNDLTTLDTYLSQIANSGGEAGRKEQLATLINAYNAHVIQTILTHYPVRSIQAIPGAFGTVRHVVGGKEMTLDEIEELARSHGDPRIHAALVCAARSCPPLRRKAYTGAKLDTQLADQMRAWMANPSLNRFLPEKREVRLSPIFVWYKPDFRGDWSVRKIVKKFGPPDTLAALGRDYTVQYLQYDWGLNDQGDLGANYSTAERTLDQIKSLF